LRRAQKPDRVSEVNIATDRESGACVWRVRDLRGWSEGILFSASADVLAAWYAARVTPTPRGRTAVDDRFGVMIDEIRQARRSDHADQLEFACRALLQHIADGSLPPQLRQSIADLRETLSWITPSAQECLLAETCACTGLRRNDHSERP
jgi:hypothetical protein